MKSFGGVNVVRVMHSREDIERATGVALEKKDEGYSNEALVLAVDEVLNDTQLSRAIVLYVQTLANPDLDSPDGPRIAPIPGAISLIIAVSAVLLIGWLLSFVTPTSTIWEVILIVIGQSILIRMAYRAARMVVMQIVDRLNDRTFPTNLHPASNPSAIFGALRIRRLRHLITDTSDRLVKGESPPMLVDELAKVNLTPQASRTVVRFARVHALVKDYLPPYEPRWLALALATAFVVTCVLVIERSGDRLAEGYKNYAIAVSAWIAGDIAARPRRRAADLVEGSSGNSE